jgi:replicative DNA helicase
MPAERALLGAMLRLNACIADVVPIVKRGDFYGDVNARAFGLMVAIWDAVDLVTLAERAKETGDLVAGVDYAYLGELWDAAPTAANAEHYALIIRDKAILRNLTHAAAEIFRDAQSQTASALETLEKAEQAILGIAEIGAEGQSVTVCEVLPSVADDIDARMRGEEKLGILTPWLDLNRLVGGFQPCEVTIISARISVGKTSMGLGLAHYTAACGVPALFVSLEQSRKEIVERLWCLTAEVSSQNLKTGNLSDGDMAKIKAVKDELSLLPLHIDDKCNQTMLQIGANARRLKVRKNVGLIVIDYIQLIEPESRKENREQQVAGISRRIKHLARELEVPIIALAQLNRGPEEGHGRKPRLSDLRESDALGQDADKVLLLWCPEGEQKREEVEVVVAKNRNCTPGTCMLYFRKEWMKYENFISSQSPFDNRAPAAVRG